MAATISDFPLFAPMQIEDNPSGAYDYLMCLWRDKNPDYPEFCAETCGDFYKLLDHLRQDHGLVLKSRVDYCLDCETVFQTRLDSLQHYLMKVLSTQHFVMTCEEQSDKTAALKEWLKPIYGKLTAVHNTIMDRVLFSDEMPDLEGPLPNDEAELATTQDMANLGFDEVDEVEGPRTY